MNDTVLHAIRTRRVARALTDAPVSHDQLRAVLDSARYAPHAGNRRLHRYVVVTRPSLLRAAADTPDNVLAEFVGDMRREVPRAQLRFAGVWGGAVVSAGIGIILAVMVCLLAVIVVATSSHDAIRAGRAPTFILGLPPPWSATIANVKPAPGSAPGATDTLPRCALFLGQNDSTVFLREGSGPTIRLPASTVRLDLRARDRC